MTHVLAAPDKFRGTATAAAAAAAVCEGARRAGATCAQRPMSDGGEGFVDVLGGEVRTARVEGPLRELLEARWAMLPDGTALVESAEAAGRSLLAQPSGDEPLEASTRGVGQLIAAAVADGATRVVVGCGGTATTDGGSGCLEALDELGVCVGIPLVAACDVSVRFVGAARRFGPQKGADHAQVALLEQRLMALAARYAERFGRDVTAVDGTGAGGGLAGALVAIGAEVRPGARFVADHVGLDGLLADSDVVVTGEGAIDDGTLDGKVVQSVLAARPALPAIVVCGAADPDAIAALRVARDGPLHVAELGRDVQVRLGTLGAIAAAVEASLSALLG